MRNACRISTGSEWTFGDSHHTDVLIIMATFSGPALARALRARATRGAITQKVELGFATRGEKPQEVSLRGERNLWGFLSPGSKTPAVFLDIFCLPMRPLWSPVASSGPLLAPQVRLRAAQALT